MYGCRLLDIMDLYTLRRGRLQYEIFSTLSRTRMNQNQFGAKTRWPSSFYYELQRECIDLIFVEVILSSLVFFIEDHQSGIRCQFH